MPTARYLGLGQDASTSAAGYGTLMRMPPNVRLGVLLGVLVVADCGGSPIDVTASLRLTQVSSGWFDAGPDSLGRNKLVPSVSFRLENNTDDKISYLQINGVFHRRGEEEDWGTAFVRAFGREGLDAGQTTTVFRLESERGYTGEQARDEMLAHRDFVDVTMDLFVKHRGNQWIRLDSVDVDRQLMMR